jgi:hypothetical protein
MESDLGDLKTEMSGVDRFETTEILVMATNI